MKNIILIERIKKHISTVKKRNPLYSRNSFADKTHIDRGTLSKIISGKRNISNECAKKIISEIAQDEYDFLKEDKKLVDKLIYKVEGNSKISRKKIIC